MQAQQAVVMAEAELERSRRQAEQTVVTAEAESRQRVLAGEGEASRLTAVGRAEASALGGKVQSYGDPRLYALAVVAEHLSRSTQPLVPHQVLMTGGGGAGGAPNGPADGPLMAGQGGGAMGLLMNLLVADRLGFRPADADANGHPTVRQPASLPPDPAVAVAVT
jgi:hypothetical protein